MKIRNVFVMTLIMALIFVGCSTAETKPGTTEVVATEEVPEVVNEVVTLDGPIAEGPTMLTSAGQSADVKMIEALIKRTEMQYEINTLLTPDLFGDTKTLILAIGGSSKGLGAAGINTEDELDRIAELLAKAKEDNVTIIGMHVGGEGRRGELSDKFIEATVPFLDYFIYVESGNQDNLLSDLASGQSIPFESVDSISASYQALEKAFN